MHNRLVITSLILLLFSGAAAADDASGRVVTLDAFVAEAAKADTEFEEILIDRLDLRYEKALQLPSDDLVLEAAEQFVLFFDTNRDEPQTDVSLSKLFPFSGTEIGASFGVTPKFSSRDSAAEVTVSLGQPIARNAFGHSTRLLEHIVGIETDVARHQIIEAYEDYLAVLLLAYLDWYEAHEELRIGESSYQENLKLLDNIKQRRKSNIALPIDVNKITLQVMAKKEKLLEIKDVFRRRLNTVRRALRESDDAALVPAAWEAQRQPDPDFETEFNVFREEGRTFRVLRLLEEKIGKEWEREADDLLPSIDFIVGYTISGDNFGVNFNNRTLYAGVEGEWPFMDSVGRAEEAQAKIAVERQKLSSLNTEQRLLTRLKNIREEIHRERELMQIAREKIGIAEEVVEDETENYTYGKVTLNDYIQAVNRLDDNRFSFLKHEVLLQKLLVEWMRLTDTLIRQKEVENRHPRFFVDE